jgi:signal transduction histidine kinase/DNA-binding response OmpR family regulator/ligand-binding sensor domain-containing protein
VIRSLTLVLLSIGLVLFGLVPVSLRAQEYVASAREFRTTDGLSNDQVLSLLEDREGFIWVGTKYGLNRFDGHNFQVFTKESHGLQSNIVDELMEGPQGRIWIIRFQETMGQYDYYGVDILRQGEDRVDSLETVFPDLPFSVDQVDRLFEVPNGILFALENGDFYLYSLNGIEKLAFPTDFRFLGSPQSGQFFGQHGRSYVTLDQMGKELMSLRLSEGEVLREVVPDGQGNLWCLAGYKNKGFNSTVLKRLLKIDPEGEVTEIDELNENSMDVMFTGYRNGRSLLYIYRGGIREYDLVTGKVYINKQAFQNRRIVYPGKILSDHNGGFWLGDYMGLRVFTLEPSRFRTYLKDEEEKVSARGMTVVGNELIYTYPSSPHALDLTSRKKRSILGGNQIMKSPAPFSVRRLPNDHLIFGGKQMIEVDDQGQLDRTSDFSALGAVRVWSFKQDREGNYWLGFGGGDLMVIDSALGTYRRIENNGFTEITHGAKWSFFEDGDYFWVATQNGLYLVHKGRGIIAQFSANATEEYYLPAVIFHHIHKDKRGHYWLATGDGGLIRFTYDPDKPAKPSYRQYKKQDGLPSLELYAVLEDEKGFFWISTANGLVQFDPTSEAMVVYYEEQGIADNEFNRLSFYQHTDGQIFFGGLNGITAFFPADFHQVVSYDVPLCLSAASLFSSEKDGVNSVRNDFLVEGVLTMYPDDNFLNLEFALQDYFYSDRVRYSYRISGIREEWTPLENNALQLVGLPYGNHTLEVRARGRMNKLSAEPLHIDLVVVRPFYLRWWFLLLAGLTMLISIWQYNHRRKRALLRRQEVLERMVAERTKTIREDKKLIEEQALQLKELDELKSKFFENVSHELRTPLTLILGPLEKVLKRNRLENQDFTLLHLMRDNAKRLHKRINELLDLSSIDALKMSLHPEPVELYAFVKNIMAQFESSANLRSIELSFEYQLDQNLRVSIDPDKVEKILYNLLSNAIKFTPEEGGVKMSCSREKGKLLIAVSDTGIGIPEKDLPNVFDRFQRINTEEHVEGTGIGLALCKELAVLMEGEVTVISTEGMGSTFTLQMPLRETFGTVKERTNPENSPELAELSEELSDISGEPILVVEDNPNLREYLRLILEDFNVKTAAHGREALEILEGGFQPVLMVTDIMMPVMDGMELLRIIRDSQKYRSLPVIMLTAKAGSTEKIEALRVGVDDYLTKPFVEEELIARMQALISNSRERIGSIVASSETGGGKPAEESIVVSKADLKWLQAVEALIMDHVGDGTFGIDQLADKLDMSTRRVQQKIKAITGMTPKKYQREIQLERARRLLESGDFRSVAEISQQIGFTDAHYFSKLYEKRFGKLPSDY